MSGDKRTDAVLAVIKAALDLDDKGAKSIALRKAQEEIERLRAAAVGADAGAELEAMRGRKDAAYEERNKVVAALARVFPSGVARTAIEGWSDDWHGCVYIDLPSGQVSWHFHDSQAHLFDGLPPYGRSWDGHDTPEKYRRVAALAAGDDMTLVPKEPTPEMCRAGGDRHSFLRYEEGADDEAAEIYRAMLSVAAGADARADETSDEKSADAPVT